MYAEVRGGLPRVTGWAIPRVITSSRTAIVKAIAADIAVPQGKLYRKGNRRRPVSTALVRGSGVVTGGRVTIDKGRLPLGRFSPKQHWKGGKSGGRVRTRVSYKISKGGARQKIQDAFLVEMASGYQGLFRREGKARLPLYELHGPSVPEVAEKNAAVRRVMDVDAGDELVRQADRRIDYLLERAARAA